jgi:hypothetical protein
MAADKVVWEKDMPVTVVDTATQAGEREIKGISTI